MTRIIETREIEVLDQIFESFSSSVNRQVLDAMENSDRKWMGLEDIENEMEDNEIVNTVDLKQNILPGLSEAGLVIYDEDSHEAGFNYDLHLPQQDYQDIIHYLDLFTFNDDRVSDSDSIFSSLASEERRAVTSYVLEDGPAVAGELAEDVMNRGLMEDKESASSSLHHTHLPKLDDLSMVDFDPHEDTVYGGELMESYRSELEEFFSMWYGGTSWEPDY